jgi:hypothetical protein
MPSSAPDTHRVLTLKRQNTGGGALLAALERAWQAIGGHHPDLPPAHIVTGQGSGQRGGLLLGHLAPDRWQPTSGGELVHELLIAGEGLARGPVDVFTTELHEAVHALALARAVADTSRDGRYHNKRYRDLARELGLQVERDPRTGWSETTLPAATRERYQDAIDALERAITLHRLREPTPDAAGRNLAAAVCGCPRRIRVAPGTLREGEITCQVCRQPFTTPGPDAASAPPRQHAAPAADASAPHDPAARRDARRGRRGTAALGSPSARGSPADHGAP